MKSDPINQLTEHTNKEFLHLSNRIRITYTVYLDYDNNFLEIACFLFLPQSHAYFNKYISILALD